ncbi:MAG: hypothetical protein ABEH61_02435 [Haloarculaceae archaeon]
MATFNASRGFMYTSLPGSDSTETSKLTPDIDETDATVVADD